MANNFTVCFPQTNCTYIKTVWQNDRLRLCLYLRSPVYPLPAVYPDRKVKIQNDKLRLCLYLHSPVYPLPGVYPKRRVNVQNDRLILWLHLRSLRIDPKLVCFSGTFSPIISRVQNRFAPPFTLYRSQISVFLWYLQPHNFAGPEQIFE
jgi:hypothetical protein